MASACAAEQIYSGQLPLRELVFEAASSTELSMHMHFYLQLVHLLSACGNMLTHENELDWYLRHFSLEW